MDSEVELAQRKGFNTEIKERLSSPWGAPFLGYLLIVFLMGGIGIILNIIVTHINICQAPEIAKNIGVFFIAIIVSSSVDLNLTESIINRKAFLIWSTLIAFVSVVLLVLIFTSQNFWSYFLSGIGVIISVIIWVLANSDSEKFSEGIYNNLSGKNKGHGVGWNKNE